MVSAELGLNGGLRAVRAWAGLGGGKTPLVLWDTQSLLTVLEEEEGVWSGQSTAGVVGNGKERPIVPWIRENPGMGAG